VSCASVFCLLAVKQYEIVLSALRVVDCRARHNAVIDEPYLTFQYAYLTYIHSLSPVDKMETVCFSGLCSAEFLSEPVHTDSLPSLDNSEEPGSISSE
jgi:hypothetical protein